MITKEIVDDKIEILEDGIIEVREVTRIIEDGVVISQKFTNRRIIEPGVATTKDDSRLNRIVSAVHTPDIVSKFMIKKKDREDRLKQEHKNPKEAKK